MPKSQTSTNSWQCSGRVDAVPRVTSAGGGGLRVKACLPM